MKVLHVVGARPNFPKLAPIFRAAAREGLDQCVVHTGQHYDDALSASFFRDLCIAPPDENLEVGSSSHAVQVARIMERFEPVLLRHAPDWVVVYGDVNSTRPRPSSLRRSEPEWHTSKPVCGVTTGECPRRSTA